MLRQVQVVVEVEREGEVGEVSREGEVGEVSRDTTPIEDILKVF